MNTPTLPILGFCIFVGICVHLRRIARRKGYPGWPFIVLLIVTWPAGVLGGQAVGSVFDTEIPARGATFGLLFGWLFAIVGNMVLVRILPRRNQPLPVHAVDDERAYIEWRKRQGSRPAKARLADEDEEEAVVDLQPADSPPPPRAVRKWKRQNWGGGKRGFC